MFEVGDKLGYFFDLGHIPLDCFFVAAGVTMYRCEKTSPVRQASGHGLEYGTYTPIKIT